MTSTEQDQYIKEMFDYEDTGYQAAESGDYAKAIGVWVAILSDESRRGCFSEEALGEMAFNLAAAYYLSGDDASFEQTVSNWSISKDDQQKIKDAVQEEA
jgi:hypothetical protein